MSVSVIDCDGDISSKGTQIYEAFITNGCTYLTNYEFVTPPTIRDYTQMWADDFWGEELEYKMRFGRAREVRSKSGYSAPNQEHLNKGSFCEMRESFIMIPSEEELHYPSAKLAARSGDLFARCNQLSLRILESLQRELCRRHVDFVEDGLTKYYEGLSDNSSTKNGSALRIQHYPPFPAEILKQSGESDHHRYIRCGEHTDSSTLTLLWQDDVGGLEIRNSEGDFVAVPPVRDAVFVNGGDLLQRWTNDRIMATPHRVIVTPSSSTKSRYSLAHFLHPDRHTMVAPIDGDYSTYTPVDNQVLLDTKLATSYVWHNEITELDFNTRT